MSEQVDVVTEPTPIANRMTFEEFLIQGNEKLKLGRKGKHSNKFGEFLGLGKSHKLRKLFLEVLEKKVVKELNLEGKEVDWSQIDWNTVWSIIKLLLPILLLLL